MSLLFAGINSTANHQIKSVGHFVSITCSTTSHVYSEVFSITKPLAHYPHQLNQPY